MGWFFLSLGGESGEKVYPLYAIESIMYCSYSKAKYIHRFCNRINPVIFTNAIKVPTKASKYDIYNNLKSTILTFFVFVSYPYITNYFKKCKGIPLFEKMKFELFPITRKEKRYRIATNKLSKIFAMQSKTFIIRLCIVF